MSVHIIGSFPRPLYKGFDKEEYANLFLEQGSFIMRPLSFFREIEDTQRKDKDEDEGEGRVVIFTDRPVLSFDQKSGKILSKTNEFGPVNFTTTSINPRYIFCFHGPRVDLKYITCRYQRVLRIGQPNTLVRKIASCLGQYPNLPNEMWLECVQVRYDKNQSVRKLPEPAGKERAIMSYGQKEPKFSSDCEYRLALTLPLTTTSPPTIIIVELHKRLGCAEILATTS